MREARIAARKEAAHSSKERPMDGKEKGKDPALQGTPRRPHKPTGLTPMRPKPGKGGEGTGGEQN
jgi:hypothetical protein